MKSNSSTHIIAFLFFFPHNQFATFYSPQLAMTTVTTTMTTTGVIEVTVDDLTALDGRVTADPGDDDLGIDHLIIAGLALAMMMEAGTIKIYSIHRYWPIKIGK